MTITFVEKAITMFEVIKIVSKALGELFSYILPYKFSTNIKAIGSYFFSGYIGREFYQVGRKFYIQSPVILKGSKYISIGKNFQSNSRLRLEAHDSHRNNRYSPRIKIGDNVAINYDCHIACINSIIIGNNVLIASKVFITDHFHGKADSSAMEKPPNERLLYTPGPVYIEDNVWIGENVSIMPNVTIGKNCIVGANSVVTKSFPQNSVIAGVPARLIKKID